MSSAATSADNNATTPASQPFIDRRPVAQPITAVEMYRLAKIDYMSGHFDSADLAAKYSTTRMMFVTQIKPKQPDGNGWFAEAITAGVTPKPESPMVYRRLDLPTIQKIRSDLYDGMSILNASSKYRISVQKVKALIAKYGWAQEIRQRRAERNRHKPKPAAPEVTIPAMLKAEAQQGEPDFGDSEDIGAQMKEFIKAAMMQLKFLTGEVMASNSRKEKMSSHKFQEILEKFCQIAEAIKKMKSASPSDLSGSGGSGRLVRAGVLAETSKSPTDMAPPLARTPA